MPTQEFTFIDLFAGIGGMRLAFEAVGGKCVFTSEIDKYCQETYRTNFSNSVIHGDITTIHEKNIPSHDVLVAGFPCQPFSSGGTATKNFLNQPIGFNCTSQGTLFFEIERILRYHKPKAFLLENIKNLTSHDKGNTFAVIHDRLKNKLGYNVYYKVISAVPFVPQKRERIFIVGFKENVNFSWDLLQIPPENTWPVLSSILEKSVPEKYTLSDKLWSWLQNHANKHASLGHGFKFGLVTETDVARTLSSRYHKDGSEILISQFPKNPRKLTPRECSRLMGFDTTNRTWKIPVSDTQAYKQFGNSVVVPVVEAVATLMKPFI